MSAMDIIPIPVSFVSGVSRRQGWRATLCSEGVTVWRCSCDRPHLTENAADRCGLDALRARLGRRGMRIWSARFQNRYTPEEMASMDEARELVLLETQLSLLPNGDPDNLPARITAAIAEISRLEHAAVHDARTWEEIQHNKDSLEVIRTLYKRIREVRDRAQVGIMCAEWRGGVELIHDEEKNGRAPGGQPYQKSTRNGSSQVDRIPSLAEKVGHRQYALRLKQLGEYSVEAVREACDELLNGEPRKDATLNAVLELFRTRDARARRKASLDAEPLPEGMDYRIGDCREVLNDIEDNSVAAVITDPPYADADVLHDWLGKFAARVLVPGGMLICYTGTGLQHRYSWILSQHLTYLWTPILLHGDSHILFGVHFRANHKPILAFVKGGSGRRIVHGRLTIIPDVLNYRNDDDEGRGLSAKDKSGHAWAQGDAGVRVWIHHLTHQQDDDHPNGDLIVDPFAGTGLWGRIAAGMGRRWIGCDVVKGGKAEAITGEIIQQAEEEPSA